MSNDTIRVVVAYHSGYGHTGKQAQAVARGAASVEGTEAELRETSRSQTMSSGKRSTAHTP